MIVLTKEAKESLQLFDEMFKFFLYVDIESQQASKWSIVSPKVPIGIYKCYLATDCYNDDWHGCWLKTCNCRRYCHLLSTYLYYLTQWPVAVKLSANQKVAMFLVWLTWSLMRSRGRADWMCLANCWLSVWTPAMCWNVWSQILTWDRATKILAFDRKFMASITLMALSAFHQDIDICPNKEARAAKYSSVSR